MKNFRFTRHLEKRMGLRGLKPTDVDYILENGEQVKDSICMTDSFCSKLIGQLKKEINKIERLKGKTVVVEGGVAITTFHMNRNKFKVILRGC